MWWSRTDLQIHRQKGNYLTQKYLSLNYLKINHNRAHPDKQLLIIPELLPETLNMASPERSKVQYIPYMQCCWGPSWPDLTLQGKGQQRDVAAPSRSECKHCWRTHLQKTHKANTTQFQKVHFHHAHRRLMNTHATHLGTYVSLWSNSHHSSSEFINTAGLTI